MTTKLNTEMVHSQRDVERIEQAIDKAINVADDLIRIADEENQRLESGRPASLDDLLSRKQKLASEFDAFFKEFKAEREAFLYASEEKFNQLQDRIQILAQSFMENASNLNRAKSANERRINAIMRAIRENQDANALPGYGSKGQAASSAYAAGSLKPHRKV
nr:flagellar export chaperone FlgN [uncultured Cohaesibacter sp.]